MLRLGGLVLAAILILAGAAQADDPAPANDTPEVSEAQALLDKATEVKLSAESMADLNQVIKLCRDALDKGLEEANQKFAKDLLASSLSQRGELICLELFERPASPNRARKLVQMAVADLEETIQLAPDQQEAHYLLGRIYSHLGEADKGLKALDEAVRLAAEDPAAKSRALVIRARLRVDPAARQADYDEAIKLTPKDPDALRFRGLNYLTQNDLQAAVADLKAAVELDPEDADTQEALGLALALREKFPEALECFDKTIKLNPNAHTAYTHRARVRATMGDLPAAITDAEQAMKLAPGSAQALLLHASLLSSTGKFDQALTELSILRQVMPDNAELLLQIGALYQATKQHAQAVKTYDHLLLKDPQLAAGFRGRGDAHLNLGHQTEAIADYEEALKLEPKNSGVLNNLAWVLATSTEDKLRNGKRAVELAKEACEVTQYKQAHILSTLAAGYAESGDFESAVTWSQKAVELGDTNMKGQLAKELESYQAHKPWREATPAEGGLPSETPGGDANVPAQADTAKTKRG